MLERDGKMWTVADIDHLEQERDDYKNRWEILGRVSQKMLDRQAAEIRILKAIIDRIDPPKP